MELSSLFYATISSGPTPQVASSATHMSAQVNKERKKRKRGEKKRKEKEKRTLSRIRTRVVRFTDSESNHSSMGARSHRTDCTQTHIHTCTFLWRAKKDGGDSRGFCALVGEDGGVEWRLFCEALVQALGKSRCSYFADTSFLWPVRLFTLHCVDQFSLTWGVFDAHVSVCHWCNLFPFWSASKSGDIVGSRVQLEK